jgi:high affinity sulfate transporter 1
VKCIELAPSSVGKNHPLGVRRAIRVGQILEGNPDGGAVSQVELARYVPGLALLRGYERRWLRADLIAGLVLATLLVPQGMAYAELAGLPAVTGLYTTIACLVGYALMGPSRILVLGPDSSVSPMIFAALTPLVAVSDDPTKAIALAGMLALLVGAVEIGLGVLRLGFVADLLSKEVKVGYINGLAVVIVVGQLPKLCGFSTDAEGVVEEAKAFFTNFDKASGTAIVVGLSCIALLFLLPMVTRRIPAILVVIVAATALSALLDLEKHGVSTVGSLPQGLPTPKLPWTSISDVLPLLIAAVGITLVSLTDTIATSASFAARRGDRVDPNQEMLGVGCSNVAASFFQGFAVSSSASRTAVAEQSGAKSQVTGLVGAGSVVILLVFLNSLLAALPQTTLAAVVIVAATSLVDVGSLRRYWQVRRSAVFVSLAASAGVIIFGVLPGILLAIGLSVLLFFRSNWWPRGEVLARRRDGTWHAPTGTDSGEQRPAITVFRWEAPLFFANAGIFANQVRALVEERSAAWVILQCEAITDIDVTAADTLEQLDRDLDLKGVHLAFVELRTRLQQQIERYGLYATLDRAHFYPSIDAALADIGTPKPERPEDRSAT